MSHVIDVRQITALLSEDPQLMRRWKAASAAGRVQAMSVDGRNLATVDDDELLDYLRTQHQSVKLTLLP